MAAGELLYQVLVLSVKVKKLPTKGTFVVTQQ
jgi:hypothetical protein